MFRISKISNDDQQAFVMQWYSRGDWDRPSLNQLKHFILLCHLDDAIRCAVSADLKMVARYHPLQWELTFELVLKLLDTIANGPSLCFFCHFKQRFSTVVIFSSFAFKGKLSLVKRQKTFFYRVLHIFWPGMKWQFSQYIPTIFKIFFSQNKGVGAVNVYI